MVSYTNQLTQYPVQPSLASINDYNLTAIGKSIVLNWPWYNPSNGYVVSTYINISSQTPNVENTTSLYTITLPNTSSAANGISFIFINVGNVTSPATYYPISILDAAGNPIYTVEVGTSNAVTLILRDASTVSGNTVVGTWEVILYGSTGGGDLNPGNLAGLGLIGVEGFPIKLNKNTPMKYLTNTSYTISGSDNASLIIYQEGNGDIYLPDWDDDPASIPTGFSFSVSNILHQDTGGGILTIHAPVNGKIDFTATEYVLLPGNSVVFTCGGLQNANTAWFSTVGTNYSNGNVDTYIDLTGKTSPYVLTSSEALSDYINFNGTISSSFTICIANPTGGVPYPISNVYIITNNTTGGYPLSIKAIPSSSTSYTIGNGITQVFVWDFNNLTLYPISSLSSLAPLPDGTATAPSLYFQNAPQSGIYNVGGFLSIAATGALSNNPVAQFASTNIPLNVPTLMATTTGSLVGYSFQGHPTYGMTLENSSTEVTLNGGSLSLNVAGTQVMNVTSTNVTFAQPLNGATALSLNVAGTQVMNVTSTGITAKQNISLVNSACKAVLSAPLVPPNGMTWSSFESDVVLPDSSASFYYAQPLAMRPYGNTSIQYQMSKNILQGANFDLNPCGRTGRSAGLAATALSNVVQFPADRFAININQPTNVSSFSYGLDQSAPTSSISVNNSFANIGGGGVSIFARCTSTPPSMSNSGNYLMISQGMEIDYYKQFQGQPLILSFWAKANTNFTFSCVLFSGGVTNGNAIAASNRYIKMLTTTPNTWKFFTVFIPANSLNVIPFSGRIGMTLAWVLGANSAQQNGTDNTWASSSSNLSDNTLSNPSSSLQFNLYQPQLEVGTFQSPFEIQTVSKIYSDCERFYQNSYDVGVQPGVWNSNINSQCSFFSESLTPNTTYLNGDIFVGPRLSTPLLLDFGHGGITPTYSIWTLNSGSSNVTKSYFNYGTLYGAANSGATINTPTSSGFNLQTSSNFTSPTSFPNYMYYNWEGDTGY